MSGNVVTLAEIVVEGGLQTGPFGSQLKANEYTEAGIPVVMPKDIDGGKITTHSIAYTTSEKSRQLTKHLIKSGDILFPRRGDLGRIAVAQESNVGWICGTGCLRARLAQNAFPDFIHQYLQLDYVVKWLKSNALGQTMLNLNTEIIGALPIYLPSYEEQKSIAKSLQTWDAAIEKTEALIEAKERQFGWLQNELMRKNSQGWALKSLKDISSIKKGQQVNRDTLDEVGDYPVWNGGISPSGYTDKSNAKAGAITISEGGNSCGFVNFCKVDFWLGGHCYAIKNLDSSINPDFLFFFLKSIESNIMQLRVGSGLPNIQRKDIEKLQTYLPTLEKQKSIANIMNAAKKEISLLAELVIQYRMQKRWLIRKMLEEA